MELKKKRKRYAYYVVKLFNTNTSITYLPASVVIMVNPAIAFYYMGKDSSKTGRLKANDNLVKSCN